MSVKKSSLRLKDRRRRTLTTAYIFVGVLIVVVISAVAYLTRLQSVTVSHILVTGAEHVAAHDVEQTVDGVLSGTYGLILPKRMTYLVPRGAVAAAIVSTYPAVQSVHIARTSGTELTIALTERVPVALWCTTTCFRMDEYGYIFAPAQANDTFRKYHGGAHSLGDTFVPSEFHDFDRLVTDIEKIVGSSIHDVVVDGNDAFLKLSTGGEVRFVRSADSSVLTEKLRTIVASSEFSKNKKLDYVELRFADRVLVKFIGN